MGSTRRSKGVWLRAAPMNEDHSTPSKIDARRDAHLLNDTHGLLALAKAWTHQAIQQGSVDCKRIADACLTEAERRNPTLASYHRVQHLIDLGANAEALRYAESIVRDNEHDGQPYDVRLLLRLAELHSAVPDKVRYLRAAARNGQTEALMIANRLEPTHLKESATVALELAIGCGEELQFQLDHLPEHEDGLDLRRGAEHSGREEPPRTGTTTDVQRVSLRAAVGAAEQHCDAIKKADEEVRRLRDGFIVESGAEAQDLAAQLDRELFLQARDFLDLTENPLLAAALRADRIAVASIAASKLPSLDHRSLFLLALAELKSDPLFSSTMDLMLANAYASHQIAQARDTASTIHEQLADQHFGKALAAGVPGAARSWFEFHRTLAVNVPEEHEHQRYERLRAIGSECGESDPSILFDLGYFFARREPEWAIPLQDEALARDPVLAKRVTSDRLLASVNDHVDAGDVLQAIHLTKDAGRSPSTYDQATVLKAQLNLLERCADDLPAVAEELACAAVETAVGQLQATETMYDEEPLQQMLFTTLGRHPELRYFAMFHFMRTVIAIGGNADHRRPHPANVDCVASGIAATYLQHLVDHPLPGEQQHEAIATTQHFIRTMAKRVLDNPLAPTQDLVAVAANLSGAGGFDASKGHDLARDCAIAALGRPDIMGDVPSWSIAVRTMAMSCERMGDHALADEYYSMLAEEQIDGWEDDWSKCLARRPDLPAPAATVVTGSIELRSQRARRATMEALPAERTPPDTVGPPTSSTRTSSLGSPGSQQHPGNPPHPHKPFGF